MKIPKVIHYCWFGKNPLPKQALKCIKSWRRYCPDYEIIEWNESNFDINCNKYCQEMYNQKKWAFLTDYVRLKVIYEHGGIYLDTDVQLLKSLDELIENGAYMGVENTSLVATGLGFAAEKNHSFIKMNMEYYENIKDFSSLLACPIITTNLLLKYGYDKENKDIQYVAGLTIYPESYLCPKNERTGLLNITKNTYSIHHFDASWFEESWKIGQKKRWRREKIRYLLHFPHRIFKMTLGNKRYEQIRSKFRNKNS